MRIKIKKTTRILEAANAKRRMEQNLASKTDREIRESYLFSGDGFLESEEWKRIRSQAIQIMGSKCMCCGWEQTPRTLTKKINVDHIKPRKYYPELATDLNNCQILCSTCNKRKGNRHMIDYRSEKNKEDVREFLAMI